MVPFKSDSMNKHQFDYSGYQIFTMQKFGRADKHILRDGKMGYDFLQIKMFK